VKHPLRQQDSYTHVLPSGHAVRARWLREDWYMVQRLAPGGVPDGKAQRVQAHTAFEAVVEALAARPDAKPSGGAA